MTCPAGCEPGFEREGRLEVSPKRHHSAHPHQAARRSEAMECKTGPPAPERSRAARSRCRWLQSRRGATEAGAAAEPARTAGERGAEQAGMSTSFRSVMSERAELVCGRMGENLVTTPLVGWVCYCCCCWWWWCCCCCLVELFGLAAVTLFPVVRGIPARSD